MKAAQGPARLAEAHYTLRCHTSLQQLQLNMMAFINCLILGVYISAQKSWENGIYPVSRWDVEMKRERLTPWVSKDALGAYCVLILEGTAIFLRWWMQWSDEEREKKRELMCFLQN